MGAKNYHVLPPRAPRTTVQSKAEPDTGKAGENREENGDEDRHSRKRWTGTAGRDGQAQQAGDDENFG